MSDDADDDADDNDDDDEYELMIMMMRLLKTQRKIMIGAESERVVGNKAIS